MTSDHRYSLTATAISLVLFLILPLTGLILADMPLRPYLHFPPITQPVVQPPFSPIGFLLLAIFLGLTCIPFVVAMFRHHRAPCTTLHGTLTSPLPTATCPLSTAHCPSFPLWGWLGLLFTALSWLLAWTRFPWFATFQAHTFSPLWIGYIIVINAWTVKRSGTCLMTQRPRLFVALFVASAGFWWFFEYLNRFVQNWYYVGVAHFSPLEYFCFATLPFATVLPAVISTAELLATVTFLAGGLDHFRPLPHLDPRRLSPVVFLLSCIGLAFVGVRPQWLFPGLWIAPLAILTALDAMLGLPTIFTPLRDGDWRHIVRYALAALVCGFFWEMWNYGSLAQWKYTVPYVQRFHVFEMPIIGYAGYLPFGLECAVIADRVQQMFHSRFCNHR